MGHLIRSVFFFFFSSWVGFWGGGEHRFLSSFSSAGRFGDACVCVLVACILSSARGSHE